MHLLATIDSKICKGTFSQDLNRKYCLYNISLCIFYAYTHIPSYTIHYDHISFKYKLFDTF